SCGQCPAALMRTSIGITAGDPAGIGLEVTLKALPDFLQAARWVLFTTRRTFERNQHFAANLRYRWIESLNQIDDEPILFIYAVAEGDSRIPWGKTDPRAGAEALASLRAANRAGLDSQLSGIVTAPVNKYAVGHGFKGQTDFLADQCHCQRYAMAFFAATFKVVLATVHMSLRDALNTLSTDLYLDLIRLVDAELRRFHFVQRRIAVAAINPHAGEGGTFGDEDERILRPAVERCAVEGIQVTGPHSADSLYYLAHSGRYDVVIAPYHDQGL